MDSWDATSYQRRSVRACGSLETIPVGVSMGSSLSNSPGRGFTHNAEDEAYSRRNGFTFDGVLNRHADCHRSRIDRIYFFDPEGNPEQEIGNYNFSPEKKPHSRSSTGAERVQVSAFQLFGTEEYDVKEAKMEACDLMPMGYQAAGEPGVQEIMDEGSDGAGEFDDGIVSRGECFIGGFSPPHGESTGVGLGMCTAFGSSNLFRSNSVPTPLKSSAQSQPSSPFASSCSFAPISVRPTRAMSDEPLHDFVMPDVRLLALSTIKDDELGPTRMHPSDHFAVSCHISWT